MSDLTNAAPEAVPTNSFVRKESELLKHGGGKIEAVYYGYLTMDDDEKPTVISSVVYDGAEALDIVKPFLYDYGVKQFVGDGAAISRTKEEVKAGRVITALDRHEGRIARIRLLQSGKTKKASEREEKFSAGTVLRGYVETEKKLLAGGFDKKMVAKNIAIMLETSPFDMVQFEAMKLKMESE